MTLAKCLKSTSPNPVTHLHSQFCIFPLCRSDSPGSVKTLGTCAPWTLVPQLSSLSLPLRTAFLHPLFAERDQKQINKRAGCSLMPTHPKPKLSAWNNKVTPCSSTLTMQVPSWSWPFPHTPVQEKHCMKSCSFWSQDFSIMRLNLLNPAQQSGYRQC